jgi:hypothetical protein
MKFTELLDLVQRRINSVLFRLILCIYSILIIISNQNWTETWVYWVIIVVYLIIYIALLKRPVFRLTNDFVFICFILFGKDPNHPVNFIFLMLPIINSINFSGDKKSVLLYIYTLGFYATLLCYYKDSRHELYNKSNIYFLVPIGILWIINSYTTLRVKVRNFRELLNDVVDGFYLKKEFIRRPYKIYDEIISAIHKSLNDDLIESLYCFVPSEQNEAKIYVINGSAFLWKFEFTKQDLISRLREKKQIINEPLSIEGINKPHNLILYTQVEDQEYFFVFVTKTNIPAYHIIIGFFRTLEPAFTKIAKVLLSEKKLNEIRNEELQRLAESSQYVNRANKTMHFVRNRLNPLSNLLKMLDNLNNVPGEKQKAFDVLLENEMARTKIDLRGIVERANDMLEKGSNPFVFTTLKPLSIQRIFTIQKRIFGSYFPDREIDIGVTADGIKRYAYLNEEGLELFFSDWLNNMNKYKRSFVYCGFRLVGEDLVLSFRNDHVLSVDELKKLIDDLTSNDRNEIMRRTTHGLLTIKSTLEEMKVPFKVCALNENKEIELSITLKTFENENSSI